MALQEPATVRPAAVQVFVWDAIVRFTWAIGFPFGEHVSANTCADGCHCAALRSTHDAASSRPRAIHLSLALCHLEWVVATYPETVAQLAQPQLAAADAASARMLCFCSDDPTPDLDLCRHAVRALLAVAHDADAASPHGRRVLRLAGRCLAAFGHVELEDGCAGLPPSWDTSPTRDMRQYAPETAAAAVVGVPKPVSPKQPVSLQSRPLLFAHVLVLHVAADCLQSTDPQVARAARVCVECIAMTDIAPEALAASDPSVREYVRTLA